MSKTKEKKQEEKQLEMGLKEPFFNRFYKIKAKWEKLFAILETKRFFKSSSNWMMILILIVLNLLLFNYFNYSTELLPAEIPLMQHTMDLAKRLVDINSIKYIPHVTSGLTVVGILISNKLYNKKEYLSNLILLTMIFSISMLIFNYITISSSYIQ